MTREEAIFTLENGAWWDSLDDDMSDADKNPLFDALDMAISAIRAQQERPGGNLDEKGGKPLGAKGSSLGENAPLTLDELRQMDGEPVWVCFIGDAIIREDGWFIVSEISTSQIFIKGKVSLYKSLCYYGETWLAYRRKPEEGTV